MRWHVSAILLACLFVTAATPVHAVDAPEAIEFFEKRVRPILVEHCSECHGAKKQKGGLALDTRDGLRKGGVSGAALVPGDPDKSLIIRAVKHIDDDLKMPPKQKLTDAQIADLVVWVKNGAVDPRAATSRPQGMSLEDGRKFWSFQPVSDPPLPKIADRSWPQTSVDHFILARIEAAGAKPALQADRRTLLRRVTFDLTGLPPTPDEMNAFLADTTATAFERVVDRLLASPRYGERWGRHWLDVVRYADTCGNASDYPVPQAHLYRDWVIGAFNRDLRYDQFLREQIAGDLLPGTDAERLVATGYLAVAKRFGGDRNGEHHLTIEDTIDNLGRALLGFSISCARCHDHKFDPFTVGDYYGLYGILSSTRFPFPGAEVKKSQEDFVPLASPAQIEAMMKPYREKLASLDAEIKTREADVAEAKLAKGTEGVVELAVKALAAAKKDRADAQKDAPVIRTAYAVAESKGANAKIHLRGDPKKLGDETPRRFPSILGGYEVKDGGSGRRELAEWIADPKNPLTARVIVNRIWQHHFGRGIVPTPNDFGRQGVAPTHPELLDHLTSRFLEGGWSIKSLHKLILLSKTWQLECADVAVSQKIDPTNQLFWKFARRRLDAESIRDSLLFVSGSLDETAAAAHPFPPEKSWGFTQHAPFVAVYESKKRSVYLMQQRLKKHPYLALFDGADPSSSTGARLPSTTPLQALFVMNDPLVHNAAAKFAQRVLAHETDAARLAFAYSTALGRPPSEDEQRDCIEFLAAYRKRLGALQTPPGQVDPQSWAALSRALLSANEFVFVD